MLWCVVFFFTAEDGIRDAQESRGLGDVYKRQAQGPLSGGTTYLLLHGWAGSRPDSFETGIWVQGGIGNLSAGLASAARQRGAEIRLGAVVQQIVVRDGRAVGVVLASGEEIEAAHVATREEIDEMQATGRRVFEILERAWARQKVTLVNCKIEFGRSVVDNSLLVADVIDNDSWRIWPGGDKNRMLDKQVYRNLPEVTDAALADLLNKYAQVAEMTDRFVRKD